MACAADQETLRPDRLPMTSFIADEDIEIRIISGNREHSEGLLKADFEPHAAPLRQFLSYLQMVFVSLTVVIGNTKTDEVLDCKMKVIRTPNQKFFDINNGQFKLETILEPADGITDLSSKDWKGNDLPSYAAGIGYLLPADIAMQYQIKLKLFAFNGTNKRELSTTTVTVTTVIEKTSLADLQEGNGLECIERPLPKTKPQGVLATSQGTEIIKHFQNLVDNGERERFMEDMENVESFVNDFPDYWDLLHYILIEKAYFYQDERSVNEARKALKGARKHHSANDDIFHYRSKTAEAFLKAKEGLFSDARELIEVANEICNGMAPGENKAILCYEWLQYFAEKAASLGSLSEQEKKDVERYFNGVMQHHNSDQLMIETENKRLPIRCCVRQLSFYLKTSRRNNPNFDTEVSNTDLGKAQDLLMKIRKEYRPYLSTKHNALLFMFETDLYIRKGELNKAIRPCIIGLRLAKRMGKANLISGMKFRLSMLQTNLHASDEILRLLEPEINQDLNNLRLGTEGYTRTQIQQLLENLLDQRKRLRLD